MSRTRNNYTPHSWPATREDTAELSDGYLLTTSEVKAFFGITPEALQGFCRSQEGLQPVFIYDPNNEDSRPKIRYCVADIREFCKTDKFVTWWAEEVARKEKAADDWRLAIDEAFRSYDMPHWLDRQMRSAAKSAIEKVIIERMSVQMADMWTADYVKDRLQKITPSALAAAEAESAKVLGAHMREIFSDPQVHSEIKNQGISKLLERVLDHRAAQVIVSEVDTKLVAAAIAGVRVELARAVDALIAAEGEGV
jgi:hypothetical protein